MLEIPAWRLHDPLRLGIRMQVGYLEAKGVSSINRILVAWILGSLCIFLAVNAQARDLVTTKEGYVIDCSDTEANDGCYEHEECCTEEEIRNLRHSFYCDAKVNGDCSREALNYMNSIGVVIYPGNDPEFDCDDTSCGCYWQECYDE